MSDVFSMQIKKSQDKDSASQSFLNSLGEWGRDCADQFDNTPLSNTHDQLTYLTPLEVYLHNCADHIIREFLLIARDRVKHHFEETDQWFHGYWREQEIHHGTEHFEIFLQCLWRIQPSNGETIQQIDDVAEHLGNWVDEVPDWYDWDRDLFTSMYLGTEKVDTDETVGLNMPDHLRCIGLAVFAYKATAKERYLDLARRSSQRWVDALLKSERIPLAIDQDSAIFDIPVNTEAAYRNFVGALGDLDSPVDRAENFVASGAIDLFLDLWQLTGDERYKSATERLLDIAATELYDPDAGVAAAAIRIYRNMTGDKRYDEAVLAAVKPVRDQRHETLTLTFRDPDKPADTHGMGKRGDMPEWYEDDQPRTCTPVLLSLAAEIDSDDELTKYAVDLGHTYFALAVEALTSGREHGCKASTVSATARGHGRENHAGVVTQVLAPVARAHSVPKMVS